MSQLSQAQDPNWVSVPIVKFSHNTSPYGTRSFVWTHVNNRNDLDFVIRNTRVVDDYGNYQDRVSMKVTGGAEVLEMQDLSLLVGYCKGFDASHGAEYPVDLVVKSPFMAMRYPKTVNTVRRIQLKFRSDLDFKRAVAVIKDLGLRVTSKNDPVPPVPPVAPSPSPALSSASLATAMNDIPHPFAGAAPRPSSSFMMPTPRLGESSRLAASSPLKQTFKDPLKSNSKLDSPFVQDQGQKKAGHTPHFNAVPTTSMSEMTRPAPMPYLPHERADSFKQSQSQIDSIYVPQMERETQNGRMPYPVQFHQPSENTNQFGATSIYVAQMQAQRDAFPKSDGDPSRTLSASPFFSSTHKLDGLACSKSLLLTSQRPASTPVEHGDLHESWIPPKRISPFLQPRKTSQNLVSTAPELQPTIAQPSPATRTEPIERGAEAKLDVATTPVKKPALKKRVAQRKAPNPKPVAHTLPNDESVRTELTEYPIPKLANIREMSEESSPLAAKSAAASFRPASAPGLVSKAILPPKKRSALVLGPNPISKRIKTVDQGTQTQTLSGRDHTSGQMNAPVSTLVPSIPVPETTSPALLPANYSHELDAFIAKHNPQPRPKDLFETPGYADADEETRQTMLNVFICENLENADFLQLCSDAEFAWRRIGLGI